MSSFGAVACWPREANEYYLFEIHTNLLLRLLTGEGAPNKKRKKDQTSANEATGSTTTGEDNNINSDDESESEPESEPESDEESSSFEKSDSEDNTPVSSMKKSAKSTAAKKPTKGKKKKDDSSVDDLTSGVSMMAIEAKLTLPCAVYTYQYLHDKYVCIDLLLWSGTSIGAVSASFKGNRKISIEMEVPEVFTAEAAIQKTFTRLMHSPKREICCGKTKWRDNPANCFWRQAAMRGFHE